MHLAAVSKGQTYPGLHVYPQQSSNASEKDSTEKSEIDKCLFFYNSFSK